MVNYQAQDGIKQCQIRNSSILISFYPLLFCNQKIPSRWREGGTEGKWYFFKKCYQFLKLEFIKSEDVKDKVEGKSR